MDTNLHTQFAATDSNGLVRIRFWLVGLWDNESPAKRTRSVGISVATKVICLRRRAIWRLTWGSLWNEDVKRPAS